MYYTQPCDFICQRKMPVINIALLFVYKPNPNLNSGKFHTQKKSAKKYPHLKILAYCICNNKETRLQTERKKKICLKTNLHLSTKRQQQQSETSRTSSGCTGRQGHCRRSALLSHPVLMLREKDSERCLCSDKEEKICAKR